MIEAERLHEAAEVVAKQEEPGDGGFTDDAIDEFLDESTFLREVTGGTSEIGIHRGSMAYGIAVGVEAARLEAVGGVSTERFVTIHHTAGAPGPAAEVIEDIRRDHVENCGWPDLAYHVVIGGDGSIWPGRSPRFDPDSRTDYDFSGHLFVALLGNFEEEKPPRVQITSLWWVVGILCDAFDVPVGRVGCHSDYAETRCPGRHLRTIVQPWLDEDEEASAT